MEPVQRLEQVVLLPLLECCWDALHLHPVVQTSCPESPSYRENWAKKINVFIILMLLYHIIYVHKHIIYYVIVIILYINNMML